MLLDLDWNPNTSSQTDIKTLELMERRRKQWQIPRRREAYATQRRRWSEKHTVWQKQGLIIVVIYSSVECWLFFCRRKKMRRPPLMPHLAVTVRMTMGRFPKDWTESTSMIFFPMEHTIITCIFSLTLQTLSKKVVRTFKNKTYNIIYNYFSLHFVYFLHRESGESSDWAMDMGVHTRDSTQNTNSHHHLSSHSLHQKPKRKKPSPSTNERHSRNKPVRNNYMWYITNWWVHKN